MARSRTGLLRLWAMPTTAWPYALDADDTPPSHPDRLLLWLVRRQWRTLVAGAAFGIPWMLSIALIPAAIGKALDDGLVARDGRALSATTVERGDAAQLLRQAALAYQDALPVLAQQHLGHERMAHLDDALERRIPGLTEQPAYPHLRGQLALRWVDGAPPQQVVDEATWYRGTQ